MPQATGCALICIQLSDYPVFLDMADHIFGLLTRIVHRLITRRGDGIYGFVS